ncbi:CHASE2 domain-containing protein [Actomonas aquatica]|uniref:Adenylate/guanylate cyclase domain-containing protein n=1 Tax=Actomonas aquatica TaxID=2866162 RepID=A0ABZ1C770_9BACT|nr:adenylate/guanylate cyclase domain-containing protein [Opitutus sp. WL0086]WRQ87490.1 adenylate/guanylate cyclase domain-containing protein [Opitutus sp. WL0086]
MSSARVKTLWVILALLPVPVLWCFLFESGSLNRARDWSMDLRYRIRGPVTTEAKVVYVDIDSLSMSKIGNFPWSRAYLAKVARTLIEEAGVKVVGVDLVLSDAGLAESADINYIVQGNRELAAYLWNDPPVVLASSFSAQVSTDINGNLIYRQLPRVAGELPPIHEIEGPEVPAIRVVPGQPPYSPGSTGLIDTEDRGVRRVPLWAPTDVRTYYHLSVEMLRRYWDLDIDGVRVDGDRLLFVRPDGEVLRSVPMLRGQMLELNWFSKWDSPDHNPRISFYDVYAYASALETDDPEVVATGEAFFAQEQFKDALVLIGPVDPLLQDLATTPLDENAVPKVGVHGNALKTILAEKYIRRLDTWQIYVVVVLFSVLVATLAIWGGHRSALARLVAVLLVLGYVGLSLWLFGSQHLVLPLVTPVGSALSMTFLAIGWQVVQEQKAKGRIKGMFGTYLAPTVVESMINSGKDPELGGHDAEITPYFSDIQSFSSFSEVLTSSQLGELLNEYLTACTDIIQAEGGTLDKYIGDAVVAMFGAPVDLADHAYKACLTALLVQQRLDELRAKWTAEGDKWPDMVHRMRTRIGLNTGKCMIGNMGSRTRFNYTMMGDNVNLAARMESGAKAWGAFTMVADTTRVACEQHGGDRIVFRRLGRITVQGRSQPVPIHEVTGLREQVSDRTLECLALFDQGLEKYYARDWEGAAALFKRSAELEPLIPGQAPGVKANPSLVYQKIVAETAAKPPPPDWDGVYHMTSK